MTSTELRGDVLLKEMADMIEAILEEAGLGEPENEIGRDTVFRTDLELQSIDLVVLGSRLAEAYGPSVRLADFASHLDAESLLALTVGQLVDYVERSTA